MEQGAANRLTDKGFISLELANFITSKSRSMMTAGERYYKGDHDIMNKVRTTIGADGTVETIQNVPNNKIVDNQYKKMVNQKKNYLFGKPFTIQSDDDNYTQQLNLIFNDNFMVLMKNLGKDALNCGLAWLFVNYDEQGNLKFKRFAPHEVLPFWRDNEHTVLDCAVRIYDVVSYEGTMKEIIKKVEVYDDEGITYFEYRSGSLIPVEPWHENYFMVDAQAFNWERIPLVAFKYNADETPLIQMVKSLQDGLNKIESEFQDNMEEDARNTIMVLVNYDGEDLGEFRHNLAAYGAVKVRSTDGVSGDVKTLQVEVNAENYKAIISIFKKAIIENAMGYDAKDDRLGGNANQMNIQSIYNDIDLDANDMDTEFRSSMQNLMWFIDCHLQNTGMGDFSKSQATVRFNRDMLLNTGEAIDNCRNSEGLLSTRTILANHPFVSDVDAELEAIKQEKAESIDTMGFNNGDE
jgi:SPP1 family phage portal protein